MLYGERDQCSRLALRGLVALAPAGPAPMAGLLLASTTGFAAVFAPEAEPGFVRDPGPDAGLVPVSAAGSGFDPEWSKKALIA